MESQSKELNFSRLFLKHVGKGFYINTGGEFLNYPFEFLDKLVRSKNIIDNLDKFHESFAEYENLKDKQKKAFNRFEFEYNLVRENKTDYLNTTVKKLRHQLEIIKTLRKDNFFHNQPLNLIQSIIKNILKEIFVLYHVDLNEKNRTFLAKWYYLKEPILSFKFTKYPEDRRLEELFNKYLKGTFISNSTKFETFKSLFENRAMVNKVDWIDKKTSLYYFIKLLRKENVIKNAKNKHWLIASEFFLLKGEILISKDFVNQKEPQTKSTRIPLEAFVLALKNMDS